MRDWLDTLREIRIEMRRFLMGSACMGAAHAIAWTLLALYLDRLGLTKSEFGTVQSAESWGRVLIAIPAAFVFAKRRTPPVLVLTSLVAAASYFALPWGSSLSFFVIINGVRGFADSVHRVAIAPFLFRHTALRERAVVFGLSEAVHTLAGVAGSFGCGRLVAWITQATGDETQAMAIVLSAGGFLGIVAAVAFAGIREDVDSSVERPAVLPILRKHKLLILRFAAPRLVIGIGAGLVIPFMGLYFQDRFGLRPGNVANLNACGQLMMTVGFLLSPALLSRMGFVKSMVFVELASIPFFLVLAYTTSFPLAVTAFLFRGALMNSAHPVHKNFMMRASPPGLRELQNGVLGLVWGIGWVIGPALGGRILDATGSNYAILMYATVVMYLLASSSTYLLMRGLEAQLPDELDGNAQGDSHRARLR